MYDTTDFRTIVDFQHVNPGKGSAFVRTRMKNLETGQVLDVTFKSGDKVGIPEVSITEMQYLYFDGTNYSFMDNRSYEQVSLTSDEVGDAKNYIVENSVVRVTFYKGKPVAIDVENFVELQVTETQPNIKGDTSGGGGKPAVLQTGLTVTVPFHIVVGDVLKIDTRNDKYIEKVK
jgi:elongation factor P